ncbi:MAG: hypothetical protein ACKPKO_21570, partial [Candidatus Fonsibacter sp.]
SDKNSILYKYICPTEQQQDARKTREQITTTAINNLINKTSTGLTIIKRAMGSPPADKKYDVDALLEKARSEVEQITSNRVGESAAKTTANTLTVRHC